MLTRGQELAVDVDEASGVDVELQPGQMSLQRHHVVPSMHPMAINRMIAASVWPFVTSSPQCSNRLALKPLLGWCRERIGTFTLWTLAPPTANFGEAEMAYIQDGTARSKAILYRDTSESPT